MSMLGPFAFGISLILTACGFAPGTCPEMTSLYHRSSRTGPAWVGRLDCSLIDPTMAKGKVTPLRRVSGLPTRPEISRRQVLA